LYKCKHLSKSDDPGIGKTAFKLNSSVFISLLPCRTVGKAMAADGYKREEPACLYFNTHHLNTLEISSLKALSLENQTARHGAFCKSYP